MTLVRGILWLAVALACAGCIHGRYDVAPENRIAAFQKVGLVEEPRLVTIDVEFHDLGRNWQTVADGIRPEVVRGLTANRVFVEADETNREQAGHLHVVVKHHWSGPWAREVLGDVLVGTASVGLVTTENENLYDMDVVYTPPHGAATDWSCQSPVRTTVGVMAWRKNVDTLPTNEVLKTLTEGMAANFAQDFWAKNMDTQHGLAMAGTFEHDSPFPTQKPAAKMNAAENPGAMAGRVQQATAIAPAATSYR